MRNAPGSDWEITLDLRGVPFFDPTESMPARPPAPNATSTAPARQRKARPRGVRSRRTARRRGGGKGSDDDGEPPAAADGARANWGSP